MARSIEERRAAQKAYRERNKEKIRAKQRRWYHERGGAQRSRELYKHRYANDPAFRQKHIARTVRSQKLARYGLTQAQWDTLFESQGRACAICKTVDASKWHTDHCHETEKVRGILCRTCNLMLGHARDNPSTLRSAATYLDSNLKR